MFLLYFMNLTSLKSVCVWACVCICVLVCFSLASSVKTWFLQLDSTWGRSLKGTSPSRWVVLIPKCSKQCACVSNFIVFVFCSCGISAVSLGSEACGNVTVEESAPSCKSCCPKLWFLSPVNVSMEPKQRSHTHTCSLHLEEEEECWWVNLTVWSAGSSHSSRNRKQS